MYLLCFQLKMVKYTSVACKVSELKGHDYEPYKTKSTKYSCRLLTETTKKSHYPIWNLIIIENSTNHYLIMLTNRLHFTILSDLPLLSTVFCF